MSDLLFHHCTNLETLLQTDHLFGHPDRADDFYKTAYAHWENLFGFYPLFLACGLGPQTIELTGYINQFSRIKSTRFDPIKKRRVFEHKETPDNRVLLSFFQIEGVGHKFQTWEEVLCLSHPNSNPPKFFLKRLRQQGEKPLQAWTQIAKRKDGQIQVCTDRLQAKTADRLWVRNKKTKRILEKLGYKNVDVQRFPAPKWWRF